MDEEGVQSMLPWHTQTTRVDTRVTGTLSGELCGSEVPPPFKRARPHTFKGAGTLKTGWSQSGEEEAMDLSEKHHLDVSRRAASSDDSRGGTELGTVTHAYNPRTRQRRWKVLQHAVS